MAKLTIMKVAIASRMAPQTGTSFRPSRCKIQELAENATYMNVVDETIMDEGHPPCFLTSMSFKARGG